MRDRAGMLAVMWVLAAPAAAHEVQVRDSGDLIAAVQNADAGDDIVLADGVYLITGKITAGSVGTAAAPITVRAAHPLGALIRSSSQVLFEVTAPFWHFSGLDIRGVCSDDTTCEHAFHVVGAADGFELSHCRLGDFNAHLKVNADGAHHLPADGVVADNEFFDTHPRHTDNPVATVNIDNAVRWVVRGNLVHDFQKDGGGEDAYGIFVKGGSQSPVIERNLIECNSVHAPVGHMVGLSFGAHGMDSNLCPPYWDFQKVCDPEVTGGVMRNNIIGSCNGDGIYVFRSKESQILYNSMERTGGIEFRLPGSSGVVRGNVLDRPVRAVDGAHFTDGGNRLAGAGPVALPGPDALVADDYCGRARMGGLDVGALQARLGVCALLHWLGR